MPFTLEEQRDQGISSPREEEKVWFQTLSVHHEPHELIATPSRLNAG